MADVSGWCRRWFHMRDSLRHVILAPQQRTRETAVSVNECVRAHADQKLLQLLDENTRLRRRMTDAENRYRFELSRARKPLVYLACPYTHPDPDTRQVRYLAVTRAAAVLTGQGVSVFSPITHSHPMSQCSDLPGTWDFWSRIDRDFLSCSYKLVVLRLVGWDSSEGVAAEIAIAEGFGIEIEFMDEVVC